MISVAGQENVGYSYQIRNGFPCKLYIENDKLEGIDLFRVRYIAPVLNSICKGLYEIQSSGIIKKDNKVFVEFELDNYKEIGNEPITKNTFEKGISFSYPQMMDIFNHNDNVKL